MERHYPSPTLLTYNLKHTCDQGSETHSNKYSVSRARKPAWRQDALAKTVTQAVRTARALAPCLHLCPGHARATQADKLGSQGSLVFIFFTWAVEDGCTPSLLPLH